jgi:hypothetical protein
VIAGRTSAFRPDAVSSPVVHQPIAAAERRHPAELHREHEDQQDADEEGRQRDARERNRKEDLGKERPWTQRGVDAHRDAGHEREQRRHDGELERRGQPLDDQPRHRLHLA